MSNPPAICIDTESFYDTANGIGIREQGMQKYVRDLRVECFMISVCDGSETWAGQSKDFNWDSLDRGHLVSHNAGYDQAVQLEMARRGQSPTLNVAGWHCTANMTTYLCGRRDLARAVEHLLHIKVDKSVRSDANGKTWADLTAADGGKSMLEYARADARLGWELWNKFSHLWPERERRLSDLTIRQCRRGCRIDESKLQLFWGVAQKMLVQAELDLPWMLYGKKPTSPKAVAEECRKVGIPCPPVKAHEGAEAYDEWENTYRHKYAWVKAYSDYRVIKKFIVTLETVRDRLIDGDFNYDLLYGGAHTMRWSGAGGFNMQNMRKEPLFCDTDCRLVTDPGKLAEIAKLKRLPDFVAHALDIRALFIPRPGKKMILSDLSQIEPRVLSYLAGDEAMLKMLRAGQSPYLAHAIATMGWDPGADLKNGNKELYALAKARVLGLGYGCGWEKFITVAYNMAGLDITADDPDQIQSVSPEGEPLWSPDGSPVMESGYGFNSRRIVADYRNNNPLITGFWKMLDQQFKDSVGGDFEMQLPSGRWLRYPEVQQNRKAVVDPITKKISQRWVTTALIFDPKRNGVVRQPLYGGLLAENATQATARDVFGEHLLTLDETAGVEVLWSCHDEAVNECDEGISQKDVEHIMSQAPEWAAGLPVAAEAKEVPCYCK